MLIIKCSPIVISKIASLNRFMIFVAVSVFACEHRPVHTDQVRNLFCRPTDVLLAEQNAFMGVRGN